jgi:hypothetical protein
VPPRRLTLVPLVFLLLAGCAWQDQNVTSSSSWLQRLGNQPFEAPHAILEVALIERPYGDPYINRELWDSVDELAVDLDRRAILDDNGLRVGQLVGIPPHAFQSLLLSKRSCSNPHALLIPPGQTKAIYLGPVVAHSSYDFVQGTQKVSVQLDQARYCLDVTPTLTPEGHTKLVFTPKVEHGEALLPFQPSPTEGDWTLRIDKANKKYPDLSWQVTLAPNQYLIVGARLDRPDTLGQGAFLEDDEEDMQRLLVIRAGKPVAPPQPGGLDQLLQTQCPPLAAQATQSATVRGQKH